MVRSAIRTLVLTLTVSGVSGCAVFSDLLNPEALTALGVDPATIVASQGKSVIVYTNDTNSGVFFVTTISDDPGNPISNLDPLIIGEVASGESRNIVVDCPLGVVTPGIATEAFLSEGGAAFVVTAGGVAEVPFAGSGLVSGADFICGDLIEIRLVEAGGVFDFQVRVLPGR